MFLLGDFEMSKDPAVLLYTSDFLTGTFTLSDEQVGKYIRLLCLQHQKTILTEKDMLNICKSYDEDIFNKFIKTKDGYYNKRLRLEAEKRAAYSKSRSENRANKKNISKTYDKHMENENENENKDEIVTRESLNKNYDELHNKLNLEIWLEEIARLSKIKRTDIHQYLELFCKEQVLDGPDHRDVKDLKKHFRNWVKIQAKL